MGACSQLAAVLWIHRQSEHEHTRLRGQGGETGTQEPLVREHLDSGGGGSGYITLCSTQVVQKGDIVSDAGNCSTNKHMGELQWDNTHISTTLQLNSGLAAALRSAANW